MRKPRKYSQTLKSYISKTNKSLQKSNLFCKLKHI